jgi:hypothetical protein
MVDVHELKADAPAVNRPQLIEELLELHRSSIAKHLGLHLALQIRSLKAEGFETQFCGLRALLAKGIKVRAQVTHAAKSKQGLGDPHAELKGLIVEMATCGLSITLGSPTLGQAQFETFEKLPPRLGHGGRIG